MSQERVARLESLLSRVRENRQRVRTPIGMGAATPEIARAVAAVEPAKPLAAPVPEASRPVPLEPPKPLAAARPAPAPTPQPLATPVRSARPPEAPARPPAVQAPLVVGGTAATQSKVEPPKRESVAAPQQPAAPAIAADEGFDVHVIEPEPIREPARPIAQVVSRHAPQVDATFGAMLKRSLSLRPH